MAAIKPTILLIHGSWHLPQTYSKLTTALVGAGYELIDAGETIIAITHSYGGQVGSNALYGLQLGQRPQGGIANLIYMASFALPGGRSMIDEVKKHGHIDLIPLAFDIVEDGTSIHRNPKFMLGEGIEDVAADEYFATFKRFNGSTWYQPITKCAWRDIPTIYVHTLQDNTVPIEYQRGFVEAIRGEGRKVRTFELDTGHCPNLTATNEVVEIIDEAAKEIKF
ncbi:Alpha/Beta hydrolase protein [Bisporella sp. PMI_857]|nr:Alpha/Beta hydrolase protein [Bisporella sp. PMI_857]